MLMLQGLQVEPVINCREEETAFACLEGLTSFIKGGLTCEKAIADSSIVNDERINFIQAS